MGASDFMSTGKGRLVPHKLTELLARSLFRNLLQEGAGFGARRGLGTYRQFLEKAGLKPPFELPAPGRSAWIAHCERASRTMLRMAAEGIDVNAVDAEALLLPRGDDRVDEVRLYRLTQRGPSLPETYGAWWFSEGVLSSAMTVVKRRTQAGPGGAALEFPLLRGLLRERLAIRYDWNEMESLQVLRLTSAVPVIRGVGKPQVASDDPREEQVLRGGVEQFWLPWTPILPVAVTSLTPFARR